MFCVKCGKEIPDNSKFCPECGQSLNISDDVRVIHLTCDKCGASMNVDEKSQEVYCPYCGSKKLIRSDVVEIEKIRSEKEKDLIKYKYEKVKEMSDIEDKKENLKDYRKSKLKIITIILTVIFVLLMFGSFKSRHYLAAFIALIEVMLFALSWLSGMQIIDLKRKNMHKALMALALILIIPFGMANSRKVYDKLEWPKSGIAEVLPKPDARYGDISTNSDTGFYATIDKTDKDDQEAYISKCIDKGFVIESERSSYSYKAYNDDGYLLRIHMYDDHYTIDLDAPMDVSDISWPNSPLGRIVPQPSSLMGKISYEYEDSFLIKVIEMSKDDYNAYVDEVMNAGFGIGYTRDDNYYMASDCYGNEITVRYEGFNTVSIDAKKGAEEIIEPVESEEPEEIIEPVIDNTVNGVDPDLKKFLDDYEAFMDEYIAFMNTYENSDDPLAMMGDYVSMMSKYAAMSESMDSFDEDNMSAADEAYYLEVLMRVNNKLYASLGE